MIAHGKGAVASSRDVGMCFGASDTLLRQSMFCHRSVGTIPLDKARARDMVI